VLNTQGSINSKKKVGNQVYEEIKYKMQKDGQSTNMTAKNFN